MSLIRLALRRITSKWLILLIEQGLVLLSLGLTILIYEIITLTEFSAKDIVSYFTVAIATGLFGSLIFHTYKDIIRYSEIRDIFKVLQAASVRLAIWIATLFFLGKTLFDHPLPYSMVIVHAALSALLLIAFRVFVREIYFRVIKQINLRKNILIYGAGQEGISSKKAIEINTKNQYHVVAFLDDDPDKIGKKIGGTPVYSGNLDMVRNLYSEYKIETIIISAQSLQPNRKLALADFCQEKRITLKTTPPLSQWTEGMFRFNQLRNVTIEMLLGRPVIQVLNRHTIEELKDQIILVTGAAGSIGSEICRQLAQFPIKRIIALDQSETGLFHLSNEMINAHQTDKFLPILASVRDEKRMQNIMATYKPHMVFHAAAYKHVPLLEDFPLEVVKTNILGTYHAVKAALDHGVKKFVMVSTDKAVNPTNLMGASKRLAEMLVGYFGSDQMACITTRFGNVLGSNGSVVPIFKKQIKEGGPITVTHQDITRYFMTIPEASSLVIEAATMGSSNEIFVFDMGEPVRILDLAKKMIRLSGLEPHRDIEIAITGLRPGEKLYEELFQANEKLKSTHHPKIMRAETANAYMDMKEYIKRFAEAVSEEGCDAHCLKDIFAELLPEFQYMAVD